MNRALNNSEEEHEGKNKEDHASHARTIYLSTQDSYSDLPPVTNPFPFPFPFPYPNPIQSTRKSPPHSNFSAMSLSIRPIRTRRGKSIINHSLRIQPTSIGIDQVPRTIVKPRISLHIWHRIQKPHGVLEELLSLRVGVE